MLAYWSTRPTKTHGQSWSSQLPSVSTIKNRAKQNFQVKMVNPTDSIVGLAEGIIDDTCIIMLYFTFRLMTELISSVLSVLSVWICRTLDKICGFWEICSLAVIIQSSTWEMTGLDSPLPSEIPKLEIAIAKSFLWRPVNVSCFTVAILLLLINLIRMCFTV